MIRRLSSALLLATVLCSPALAERVQIDPNANTVSCPTCVGAGAVTNPSVIAGTDDGTAAGVVSIPKVVLGQLFTTELNSAAILAAIGVGNGYSAVIAGAAADTLTPATTNWIQTNGTAVSVGGGVQAAAPRFTWATDAAGLGTPGSANPAQNFAVGCRTATTVPTAVSDTQNVAAMCTKTGKLVVEPFAPRELRTVSALVPLTASVSETTLVAAGASGVFLDMTAIKLCNSSATDASVDIRDATGGTVVDNWWVAAGKCVGQSYTTPVPQTTAANNWTVQSSASVSSIKIKATFVQAK